MTLKEILDQFPPDMMVDLCTPLYRKIAPKSKIIKEYEYLLGEFVTGEDVWRFAEYR